MQQSMYDSDAILKELIRAYRLSMGAGLSADAEVRHLRRQIIRLAKVCHDLHSRVSALEDMGFHELPVSGEENSAEHVPVTCLAEAV